LAPLRDARFTKEDVRALLRDEGFGDLAAKPASACLSSRIPYGTPVVPETLRQVGACEEWLRARGYRVVRVRHHGEVARLELDADGIARVAAPAERRAIEAGLRERGYARVEIDPRGYRRGSLNEALATGP
ncbi:MAG TPA: TIGR00268 family protein, partial [Planctomycetota bacterium]|nr:TIGR00268 family protein [Planctomycetota bacterium]